MSALLPDRTGGRVRFGDDHFKVLVQKDWGSVQLASILSFYDPVRYVFPGESIRNENRYLPLFTKSNPRSIAF